MSDLAAPRVFSLVSLLAALLLAGCENEPSGSSRGVVTVSPDAGGLFLTEVVADSATKGDSATTGDSGQLEAPPVEVALEAIDAGVVDEGLLDDGEAGEGDVVAESPATTPETTNPRKTRPKPTTFEPTRPRPDVATPDGSPASIAGAVDGAGAEPLAAPGAEGSAAGESKSEERGDGPRLLTWEDVAFFEYEAPEELTDEQLATVEAGGKMPGDEQIPKAVWQLDGELVSIEGFMMPLDVVDGRVASFILARHVFGCCFGQVPKVTEWVVVEVADEEGVHAVSYDSILVTGHLTVGGIMDEFGYVYAVYQIKDGEVSARR